MSPLAPLPASPRITSPDELDRALAEICDLDALAAQADAECQRQITDLKQQFQASAVVRVPTSPESVGPDLELATVYTITDRRLELVCAVQKYAEKHRDELLADDRKSRAFPHGTIGWRCTPARVELREGKSSDDVVEAASKKDNLIAKLRELLQRLLVFPRLAGAVFFDLKLSLNKPRVKKAFEDGAITKRQLSQLGVDYVAGDERFYVDVSPASVQREASA